MSDLEEEQINQVDEKILKRRQQQKLARDKKRERVKELEKMEAQFNLMKSELNTLESKYAEASNLKEEFVNFLKYKEPALPPQQVYQNTITEQKRIPRVVKNDFFK